MGKNSILIVEDESIVAMGIKQKLNRLGYDVCNLVSTGEDAIKKAKEEKPDLILMDIKLKGKIDGIDAAKKIGENYNIPIIYLTAYGDENTLERAKVTEPYGYIIKPFKERDLRTSIEIALYKSNIERQIRIKDNAISSSINAIAIADLNGNINYINQSFLKMWGYKDKKEINEKPLVKFWKQKGKQVEIIDTLLNKGGWIGELEAERKNGEHFDVQVSANAVKNKKDEAICFMFSFVDITEKNHIKEEIIRTRNYLKNIINSASEIIIALDENGKILTWNKSAENITGYKEKKMIGKQINNLSVFENSKELLNAIKSIYKKDNPNLDEIILITKKKNKRIVRFSYSTIAGENKNIRGVLFIGRDITFEKEAHGKLVPGKSYLISDKESKPSFDLFLNLTKSGYKGLFVSRGICDELSKINNKEEIENLLLNISHNSEYRLDINKIINKIDNFCKKTPRSIIYLDRIDFLINILCFEDVIKSIYKINDIISNNNSIFLLRINPNILKTQQFAMIQEEMDALPSKTVDNIQIKDELFDILHFIYKHNLNNSLVTFKRIGKEFSIVNYTVAKRINKLESEGLIFIRKIGRSKTVHISDKGKTLLHKRQSI